MRSKIAQALRSELHERLMVLSPSERMEIALRLGENDIDLLVAARRITRTEARKEFERNRQRGRRRSACLEALYV